MRYDYDLFPLLDSSDPCFDKRMDLRKQLYGRFHAHPWFPLYCHIVDPIKNQANAVWRWISDRFIKRHHIVNTGLGPGWHDVDFLMHAACFALLGRYVEDELGVVSVDDALEYDHYRGYRMHAEGGNDEKATDLWLWYRFELPKLRAEEDADHQKFIDVNGYDYIEDLMDAKFDELMAIRRRLWI